MDLEGISDDEDREARLYAMLHYVDDQPTKSNLSNPEGRENVLGSDSQSGSQYISKTQIGTGFGKSQNVSHTGRYWASAGDSIKEINTPFQKVNINIPKDVSSRIVTADENNPGNNKSNRKASKMNDSDHSNSLRNNDQVEPIISVSGAASKVINTTTDSGHKNILNTPREERKGRSNRNSSNVEINTAASEAKQNNSKRMTPNNTGKCNFTLDNEVNIEKGSVKHAPKQKSERVSAKNMHKAYLKLSAVLNSKKKKGSTKTYLRNPFCKMYKKDSVVITLESSDDEVMEVILPHDRPPTIYIDSSDGESSEAENSNATKLDKLSIMSTTNTQTEKVHYIAPASPVPSIMSTMSDDFIQGDCSTLNISSRDGSNNFSFNFGLHGTDICDVPIQETPSKTGKKLKKNKSVMSGTEDIINKTTLALTTLSNRKESDTVQLFVSSKETSPIENECFATPTSKSKKRNGVKSKSFDVSDQSYVMPSVDVYESESSDFPESVIEVPVTSVRGKRQSKDDLSVIDMDLSFSPLEDYQDSLVMANVVGLPSDEIVVDKDHSNNADEHISKAGDSSPINKIKVKKVSKEKERNLLVKCLKDMHKYYDKPWGKNFDHIKLRQEMPKDKAFWLLDPADTGRPRKASLICGYCNKVGHRDNKCYTKPKICILCGETGHNDLRCPNKICLNCGSSNNVSSSVCGNCKNWKDILCTICRTRGHPSTRCPDIWRRYHLTTTNEIPLIKDKRMKPQSQLHCSGCAKRGHIINDCSNYIAFSDFKPASPYIFKYAPIYTPDNVRTPQTDSQKSLPNIMSEETKNKPNAVVSSPKSPGKRKNVTSIVSTSPKLIKQVQQSAVSVTQSNVPEKQIAPVYLPVASSANSNIFNSNTNDSIRKNDMNISNKDMNKNISDNENNFGRKIAEGHGSEDPVSNIEGKISEKNSKTQIETFVDSEDINITNKVHDENCQFDNLDLHKMSSTKKPEEKSNIENSTNNQIMNSVNDFNFKTIPSNIENNKSQILLNVKHVTTISTTIGEEVLNNLCRKYNVAAQVCTLKEGISLVLTGNVKRHSAFQNEVQLWLNTANSPSVELVTVQSPGEHIPRMRTAAINKIMYEFNLLKSNLGNPAAIFMTIKNLEINLVNFGSKNYIKKSRHNAICQKLIKNRKILNMILIGQAGMCGGEENCRKLFDIMNYLQHNRFEEINPRLRDEMGNYYEPVFSGVSRNDYFKLIDRYYLEKQQNAYMFTPSSPFVNKSAQKFKKSALITRIRVTMVKLRKICATEQILKSDVNINETFRFLVESEYRAINYGFSREAFSEVRRILTNTDKFINQYIGNKQK